MTRSRLTVSSLLLLVMMSACGSDEDASAPTSGLTSTTDTSTPEGPVDYDVFLLAGDEQCDNVVASPRTSTVEGAPAEALAVLLAGPTAEETSQGWWSSFTPETAGMLMSVVIEDGVARVAFDPALPMTIPNASASCGSAALLAQLDATLTQFDGIERAVYSLDGDVDAFYYWLQLDAPEG